MSKEQKNLNKELFFSDSQKGLNMIAVCSGAYGTGKTLLSLTLAHIFSIKKRKVLFFDADGGKYNINSYLGLENKYNLNDTVSKNLTLNQIIYRCEKAGFDVISGSYAYLHELPIGRLQLLVEDLHLVSSNYNNVILDVSSEKQKFTSVIAGAAKKNLLILSPNPQSTVGAYEMIEKMNKQYPNNKLGIVVNQVNSYREGMLIYETLLKTSSRFLKFEPDLLGIIRNDTRVRDCQKNQALILLRYPTSDAAKDIMAIADKIL